MVAFGEGFFSVTEDDFVLIDGAAEVAGSWGASEGNFACGAIGGEGGFWADVDGGFFTLDGAVDGVGLGHELIGDEPQGLFWGD